MVSFKQLCIKFDFSFLTLIIVHNQNSFLIVRSRHHPLSIFEKFRNFSLVLGIAPVFWLIKADYFIFFLREYGLYKLFKWTTIIISIHKNIYFILLFLINGNNSTVWKTLRLGCIHNAKIIVLNIFYYHKMIGNFLKERFRKHKFFVLLAVINLRQCINP